MGRLIYAESSGRYYNAPEQAAWRAGVMVRPEDLGEQQADTPKHSEEQHIRPLGAKALLGAVRPPR